MPDALSIGLSALKAQQRALEVTSHNIANVSTAGYSRQVVDLGTAIPEDVRPGQVGRGIDIQAIRRITDSLTNDRLRKAEGEASRLSYLTKNLGVIQQAFNEPGDNGLAQITNQLFSALQDLSANPESTATRSSAVQSLQTWTDTVGQLADRLVAIRDDLQSSLEADVATVNQLTGSIAALNQQIRAQVNLGNNPNDLLDRRDNLLSELTGYLQVNVHTDPKDLSVSVDVDGRLLVGSDRAEPLTVQRSADTGVALVFKNSGFGVVPSGGSIGAMMELHADILPGIQSELDTYAGTVARALNAIQAVGTSNSFSAQSFTSSYTIPVGNSALDLDDPRNLQAGVAQPGVPAVFAPSFADASGAVTETNLTINVLDQASGIARKYTLRYDGTGTRSLDDVISAINTGRGGGFTLYPEGSAGIAGVSARKIQVDSGYRLEVAATGSGTSIDFSQALDTRPSATAWTGAQVSLSGTAAVPATRLNVSVDADGTTVRVTYRNPADGSTVSLGTGTVPVSGTSTVAIGGLSLSLTAGAYRAGDAFGVDLGAGGAVLDAGGLVGTYTEAPTWSAADSTVTVKGRYTGSLSFDPAQPWTMKVLTAGVVGAAASAAAPNNPPQVQFTYWTGSASSPAQQTVVKTLDASLPAGSPVQIADGVYVVFGSGSLSTAGNQLQFTVDGQPDQAGLLTALGINQLVSGGESARTLSVSSALLADPNRLALATTRSEGDNTNLQKMISVRSELLFSNGSFSMDDYYQGIVAGVGTRVQQATRLGENQEALKASLSSQREQLSGVNLDEEVAGMIQQQQAYSAAARIITTARENIQTLLQMLS